MFYNLKLSNWKYKRRPDVKSPGNTTCSYRDKTLKTRKNVISAHCRIRTGRDPWKLGIILKVFQFPTREINYFGLIAIFMKVMVRRNFQSKMAIWWNFQCKTQNKFFLVIERHGDIPFTSRTDSKKERNASKPSIVAVLFDLRPSKFTHGCRFLVFSTLYKTWKLKVLEIRSRLRR